MLLVAAIFAILVYNLVMQVIWAKLVRRVAILEVPDRTLSWFIFSHFVAIHFWSVHAGENHKKIVNTQ